MRKRSRRHGKLLQTAAKYFIFIFRVFFCNARLAILSVFPRNFVRCKATDTHTRVCIYVLCGSKHGLTHRHSHGQHCCEYHYNNNNKKVKQQELLASICAFAVCRDRARLWGTLNCCTRQQPTSTMQRPFAWY